MTFKGIKVILAAILVSSICMAGCTGEKEKEKEPVNKEASFYTRVREDFTNDQGAYILWDFSEDAQGYTGKDGAEVKYSNGTLECNVQKNGKLCPPSKLNIPANTVRNIEFRVKSDSDMTIGVMGLEISIPGDGEFHDHQINMSGCEDWKDTVKTFEFDIKGTGNLVFHSISLKGLYLLPFPWLSGNNLEWDAYVLNTIREELPVEENNVVIGFSTNIDYFCVSDSEGNFNGARLDYIADLVEKTKMPVVIWLRVDPWASPDRGVQKLLWENDDNKMWTSWGRPYSETEVGQTNLCLAQTNLDGSKTDVWKYQELILPKVAAKVSEMAEALPGLILGITTTSEYTFNTNNGSLLDYNIKTINEFKNYCMEKYKTIEDLNNACGTSFKSWDLKYSDSAMTNIAVEDGFDAPRKKNEPTVAFTELWSDFKAHQINVAVEVLVELIAGELDRKYIYTHQVDQDYFPANSPIECGHVAGSNIGIDFTASQISEDDLKLIVELLGNDPSRTWGIPEWLANDLTSNTNQYNTAEATFEALKLFDRYGIQFLTPFNWRSGDVNDVLRSEAIVALKEFMKYLEKDVDPFAYSLIKVGGEPIEEGTGFEIKIGAGESVTVSFDLTCGKYAEKYRVNHIVLYLSGIQGDITSLTATAPGANYSFAEFDPLKIDGQEDKGILFEIPEDDFSSIEITFTSDQDITLSVTGVEGGCRYE